MVPACFSFFNNLYIKRTKTSFIVMANMFIREWTLITPMKCLDYLGGLNSAPTAGEMYDIAKKWEDRFGAEIIGLLYDSIDFRFDRRLSDTEIINECRNLYADVTSNGGYEEMKKIIKEKSKLHIWWN